VTFLATGVLSKNVYNTLLSTPKSRAAQVTSTIVLPALTHLCSTFLLTEVAYVGIVVTYRSRDFSDRFDTGASEAVTVIVAQDRCKKFLAGEITDDELLSQSYVYLEDAGHFRKIQVTLK
jgi:hypothetical protein